MKLPLFFSTSVVPDVEKYHNPALNRSGNNALEGIAEALWEEADCTIESCIPIPSFPKDKFWVTGCDEVYPNGMLIKMLPTLNIKILKNYIWGFITFFHIIEWRLKNRGKTCSVIVYNLYTVPIELLFLVCKLTGVKLYAILYDLGVPPSHLNLSKSTMLAYRLTEFYAKFFIKRLDGRIVINESIVEHYAPNKHYVLIDGGINKHIINSLFPLRESTNDEYVLVCAGMLWEQNGTRLLLETLRLYPDLNVKIYFAGRGNDVNLIKEAQLEDSRIIYVGMLTTMELFSLYEKADILLNLRIEESIDFHFPSKLLECLATGKYVISTPIAHAERDYGQYMGILHDISPSGLYHIIKETMNLGKKELFKVGTTAREFMLQNRTWEKRTKEMLEYIERTNTL